MSETTDALIECPTCRGKGGWQSWGDGWEEYDECRDCRETGRVTPERKAEIEAEVARIDAEIDAILAQDNPRVPDYAGQADVP